MKLHRNTWQGCFHTGRRDLKINDNGTEITSGRGIDNLPPKFEVMFFLLYNTHPGWGVLGLLGVVRFAGGCSRFGFEERFARGIRFGFEERFPGGVKGLDSKKSLGCEERFTHLGFEERLRYINYSNQYYYYYPCFYYFPLSPRRPPPGYPCDVPSSALS